jgi:uroporphyrin-III C-methyltransferase / precorrin-2 dehydrogenase / sirohydrochlorin ferrochelatase
VDGLPLLLDLTGRRVVVVGAGRVAARRIRALADAGAAVEVIALQVGDEVRELGVRELGVDVRRRAFVAADVAGAWLVFACTDDPEVNAAVAAAAQASAVFCVRADAADGGSARTPAVVRRDGITVAVNGGDDPRRATALRDAIAEGLDLATLRWRPR